MKLCVPSVSTVTSVRMDVVFCYYFGNAKLSDQTAQLQFQIRCLYVQIDCIVAERLSAVFC